MLNQNLTDHTTIFIKPNASEKADYESKLGLDPVADKPRVEKEYLPEVGLRDSQRLEEGEERAELLLEAVSENGRELGDGRGDFTRVSSEGGEALEHGDETLVEA